LPVPLRPARVAWVGPQGTDAQHPGDPWALFDGRATTGLQAAASEPLRMQVELERATPLAAVTVLGPAEGKLTVFAQDGNDLRPLPSLSEVVVLAKAGEWKHFSAGNTGPVESLVLQWTASAGAGPTEIGLWGLGLPERNATDTELADRILSDAAPGSLSTAASPQEGRIAGVELGAGAPPGAGRSATFQATLTADPRALARAFLVYELTGLGHFIEPVRQINDLSARGGTLSRAARSGAPSEGGLQVEEIAPSWLRQGDNTIRFLPLPGGGPDYGVRNVRIVGTAHASLREARLDGTADPQGSPEQRLSFEVPSQPHDVVFELLKPSDGRLVLRAPDVKGKPVRIDLKGLESGWHRADVGALPAASTIGIAFEGAAKKGRGVREDRLPALSEVALTSSEVPTDSAERQIAVSNPLHGECVDHLAHVRGFVRTEEEVTALRIAGHDAASVLSRDGSFDLAVPEPPALAGHAWEVPIEAALQDGTIVRRTVALEPCIDTPSRDDGKRAEDEGAPFAEVIPAGQSATVAFGGARLEIPAGALDKDTRITVRPLVGAQVPKMGPRMGNVVPEGRAFRFGPHGLKFKKPVKITLPYDPGALGPGMHEQHVFSFYFDEASGQWQRIGRFAQARGGELVSLTEHFTDFVNATLAMPDEPGEKTFNANEMKGIKLASPSAGLGLIEPPQANGSGTAVVKLDVEIPPGRDAVEPSLSFAYQSEKANGWLGVGWDLQLPSVEIETRFGVPKYDGTEHYVLGGEALTPASSGSNLYVRRVEGRFDRIQRNVDSNGCVNSWTVTDKRGTVYTYGGQGAVLSDPKNACHVFRWGLSSMQDAFGNQMQVAYFTDSGLSASEPFTALYPDHILYTGHTSGLPPAYKVQFVRDGGSSRPDNIVNGRPGFQEKTRFRLDHVDVLLEQPSEQIIRRYQLGYLDDSLAHFHKSLLSSIALQGVPKGTTSPDSVTPTVQLDQHTFDYYQANVSTGVSHPQVAGFGSQQTWGTGPRPDDALSRSDDTMGGGSLSVGVGFAGIGSVTGGGGLNTGDTT
jgi:hypothetical protein